MTIYSGFLIGQERLNAEGSFWNEKMIVIAKPESKEGVVKLKRNLFRTHENFFTENKEAFRLSEKDKMEYVSTIDYKKGIKIHRYQQLSNDIVVDGFQLVLLEKEGEIRHVLGKIAEGIEQQASESSVDLEAAKQTALTYVGYKMGILSAYETIVAEPVLKYVKYESKEGASFHLAYELTAQSKQPGEPEVLVYVDVLEGKVIKSKTIQFNCNCCNGSVNTLYNGSRNLTTHEYSIFNKYELLDNCRGNGIETKRIRHSNNAHVRVRDPNNTFVNNDIDKAAASAHWAAQQTFDYFLNEHGRWSFNGIGGRVELLTNEPGDNASAGFTGNGNNTLQLIFGEGNVRSSNDLVSLDVVGHEFTHGVIATTSDLTNADESGALGESFADIFGAMVEFQIEGAMGDYLIGEDFHVQDGFTRSMFDPDSKNEIRTEAGCPGGIFNYDQADTYQGNNWLDFNAFPNCDLGGVHLNGGPQNFWFFLLAEGGSGTNDNGVAYNVQSIGRNNAADIAFLDMVSLNANSIYPDSREASIAVAELLFGDCSNEVVQVIEAWNAIGVTSAAALNSPDPNFTSPSSVCQGTNFTVTPTVVNGVTHKWWYFPAVGGPVTPFSTAANPSITAFSSGAYVIRHEITSPCGVFTMDRNITVNAIPNVIVDDEVFCSTETAGDLVYFPNGGTMTGPGVIWQSGAWKFDASAIGAGTYTITYTYVQSGCSGQNQATIVVDQFQTAQIVNFEQNYCESDGHIPLAGVPLGGTWIGNGVYNTANGWIFSTYLNPGASSIQYTYSSPNNVCTSTANFTMYVDDPITFSPSVPTPEACAGNNECFSANPSNTYSHNPSYEWNFANGTTSPNIIACTQFAAGSYGILLEGTNECGTTTAQFNLNVVAPFNGFQITSPDPICGEVSLQTNYTGSTPIIWSGIGVDQATGELDNPFHDVVSRTITASIDDVCQISTTKTFNNHYKRKEIIPDRLCKWGTTQLEADIAPGTWSSVPSSSLDPSTGQFVPPIVPGIYTVTHHSVCNQTSDVIVLPGGPQGTEEWPKHINDFSADDELGTGIVSAYDGSYYIIGLFTGTIQVEPLQQSWTSVGGRDIYIAKYDDCGIVWSYAFGSLGDESNPKITIDHNDPNEPIYISGTTAGNITIPGGCSSCALTPSTTEKGFVAKIDSDGNGVWARIPANNPGQLNNFKGIDAHGGRVVLTGNFQNQITITSNGNSQTAVGGAGDRDIHAISIQDLGQSPGFIHLNTIGSLLDDDGKAIAIDLVSQNIFVTGYGTEAGMNPDFSSQFVGGKDVFLGSLDISFNWNWTMLLGGAGDDEGLGVDADNQVVVTGFMSDQVEVAPGVIDQTHNLSQDAFILSLGYSGQYSWHKLIGSDFNLDRGADVSLFGSQVSMIGEFSGNANFGSSAAFPMTSPSSDRDVFIASFDANLGTIGSANPVKGLGSNDFGHAISSNSNTQDYYATGEFSSTIELNDILTSNAGIDMFALRYNPQHPNIFYKKKEHEGLSSLATSNLMKAYPNPFNDRIVVETNQSVASSIEILDINGKLIYEVERIEAGEFKREFDLSTYPSGIYIIKLASINGIETIKLVKQ